jgi:hypothetical protein
MAGSVGGVALNPVLAMRGLRKKSEIARYLGKPAEEVDRMMDENDLPYVRLPGLKKPSPRFRLRDFHKWLQQWNRGCELKSFAEFEREFEEAQGLEQKVES